MLPVMLPVMLPGNIVCSVCWSIMPALKVRANLFLSVAYRQEMLFSYAKIGKDFAYYFFGYRVAGKLIQGVQRTAQIGHQAVLGQS